MDSPRIFDIPWEIRLRHDRDKVDAQCVSQGIPVPNHPEGGVRTPKRLWWAFNGPKFYPEFERRGHDHPNVVHCSCSKADPKD